MAMLTSCLFWGGLDNRNLVSHSSEGYKVHTCPVRLVKALFLICRLALAVASHASEISDLSSVGWGCALTLFNLDSCVGKTASLGNCHFGDAMYIIQSFLDVFAPPSLPALGVEVKGLVQALHNRLSPRPSTPAHLFALKNINKLPLTT